MKKRRPCAWNQTRSPKTSQSVSHARSAEVRTGKSKSSHELKKRRLRRNVFDVQHTRSEERDVESELNKEDPFGSLESFFDARNHLQLNKSTIRGDQGDTPVSSPRSRTSDSRGVTTNAPSYSLDLYSEPDHLRENEQLEWDNETFIRLQPLENIAEEYSYESFVEAESESPLSMAEENDPGEMTELETTDDKDDEEDDDILEIPDERNDDAHPPSYPIPPGVGEGIPVKPGGHRESAMSSIPLTDSAVMKEMKEADERCTVISEEIAQLKKELAELTNKEDLTQEDTMKIKEKQEIVMEKLGEFEKITRNLQRLLGLADPSSRTFAKMFGMIPYPHGKRDTETNADSSYEGATDGANLFDIPQTTYPEDKLPRVIVCGNSEQNIPKIVVADSERKDKHRFHNLSGKLNASLMMQERLAKENAQLEGGRFELEEALLERDNAVDSLQRKVYGLQAEMRMVVKENSELSRQLARLSERIDSATSPRGYPSSENSPKTLSPRLDPPSSSHPRFQSQESGPKPCSCDRSPQREGGDTVPLEGTNFNKRERTMNSPRVFEARRDEFGTSSEPGCGMCCRGRMASNDESSPSSARGACPAELENKLALHGNNTTQMKEQLGTMESELRNLQMAIANVEREQQQLEQQRKLLKCTAPCAPCPCAPPVQAEQPTMLPGGSNLQPRAPLDKMNGQQGSTTFSGTGISASVETSNCQEQLRDLREQYARLQDDYKSKLCEVSLMRTESEKMRRETRDAKEDKERAENRLIELEERVKFLESEKNKLSGSKEQLIEQEQALLVAKQRFRDSQDELEELRSLVQDQADQLEEYRNKYLLAQQQVEEQRRQLDLMEMDNARMNENVTLEIGRVKNQFQEKLAELAPLPDILKQTQVKLQEAQQLRLMAERSCEDISREVSVYKEKVATLQNEMDVLRVENQSLQGDKGPTASKFDELERRNSELRSENERVKNTATRYEEQISEMQQRIDEKMHEVTQLTAMLDQVREDSARQVARTKERYETMKRNMHGQIGEMEIELAQCRATTKAAQKDCDEIRQKMQGQINNLNEAFEQAQSRVRSLQGHVNYLKTSYSNVFGGVQGQGQGETPKSSYGETGQPPGYDSCDCNY